MLSLISQSFHSVPARFGGSGHPKRSSLTTRHYPHTSIIPEYPPVPLGSHSPALSPMTSHTTVAPSPVSYAERARKGKSPAPLAASAQDSRPSHQTSLTPQKDLILSNGAADALNSTVSQSDTPNYTSPAHATVPANNVWAARSQQHRPSSATDINPMAYSATTVAQSSIPTSRSSSRKARSRTDHPNLNDANAWPDVGESLAAIPTRSGKDTPEGSTSASAQKKGMYIIHPATYHTN